MIIDGLLQFSGSVNPTAGQLVTALGNTLSTNVIDTAGVGVGNTARDMGAGTPMEILIEVLNALTSAGAATVQFQLVEADDAAITTNVEVVDQTDAIPYATLVAGAQVPLHYNRATPYPARRYVAVRYVVGTAALTNATGQFFATIVKDYQDKGNGTIYNSGFAVS
jgi:hypothetical protein